VSPHLIEYDGKRRALRIGSPASLAILSAGAVGALAFYGTGGAIAAIGGGAVDGAGPAASGSAPSAPNVSFVGTSDTSFYMLGSTYSGDGTHSGSLYEVDTVGGTFTTTDTLGLQAGPDSLTRTDTTYNGGLNNITLATAGGAVLIGRAQYTNEFGTSAFGAVDTFTVALSNTMDFASTWGDATGTGIPTLLDSSSATPWDQWGGAGSKLEVVDTATAVTDGCSGWPGFANVLMVEYSAGDSQQLQKATNRTPIAGDTIFTRVYTCVSSTIGNPPGPGHWFHFHGDPDGGYMFWPWSNSGGTMTADSAMSTRIESGGTLTGWDVYMNNYEVPNSPLIYIDEVYRLETRVVLISTTSFTLNIRVYDSAGSLYMSGASFIGNFGEGAVGDTVGESAYGFPGGMDQACEIEMGNNDNPGQNSVTRRYIGAMACRVGGGWIGPYTAAEGN